MRAWTIAALVAVISALPGQRAEAQELLEDDELAALRSAAEAEAAQDIPEEEEAPTTEFKSGGLALQALNPEISVTGDMLGTFRTGDEAQQDWSFAFRGLGIHLEAYLDPYSRFKAAFPVFAGGTTLGEAYYTRYGALAGGNLTLGKFRQQFGVVNRWHKHGLDYVDFPLPLREVFGDGGLNQTGISADWSGQIGGTSQELTVQLTNGENANLFGGNADGHASTLAHYKLYRDLSDSTYMELGVSGLSGWNDTWNVGGTDVIDSMPTAVYGFDCSILWEPTDRMRYRNVEWRAEFYYVDRQMQAPDGSGPDVLNAWGAYTSLQMKVSRTVDVGLRYDYYQPDAEGYASGLLPLASDQEGAHRWLAAFYLTWWQSPFVKYRIQCEHEDGRDMGETEDRIVLQCVFAAGPHKHERY